MLFQSRQPANWIRLLAQSRDLRLNSNVSRAAHQGAHGDAEDHAVFVVRQAEEAMNFYTSIFKNSKVKTVSRYGDAGPGPKGTVMVAKFELEGQEFMVLNGGPRFKFTQAISFVVNCTSQQEVDDLWEKLLAGGGAEDACGWLRDKYGLSWQIIPTALGEMMSDPDRQKAGRAMQAMLKMKKIDIAEMRRAFDGK
jgi:predicted 3-demethylubiquinone-9 3-methyltransferase (glyoxalase superfamily)